MTNHKKTARLAGVLYLVFIFLVMFAYMFVDDKLLIADDAATTLTNIGANEGLFRLGFVTCLIGYAFFLVCSNVLVKLFKSTDEHLARLMHTFVVVGVSIIFACKIAVFSLIDTSDIEFASFLLALDINSYLVADIFWGLWLVPLAMLIFKSQMIPKIIGYGLLASTIYHLVLFSMYLLTAECPAALENILAAAGTIGEFVFVFWLIIKGVKKEEMEQPA